MWLDLRAKICLLQLLPSVLHKLLISRTRTHMILKDDINPALEVISYWDWGIAGTKELVLWTSTKNYSMMPTNSVLFMHLHCTCIMTNDINKKECKSCKQNETETTKIYIYFAQCHHVKIICVEKKSVLFKCFSSQTEQSQK